MVGLRDGSALKINDGVIELLGTKPARVFKKDQQAREVAQGLELTNILHSKPQKLTLDKKDIETSPLVKHSLLSTNQEGKEDQVNVITNDKTHNFA